jgi:hypothetical protein
VKAVGDALHVAPRQLLTEADREAIRWHRADLLAWEGRFPAPDKKWLRGGDPFTCC